MVTNYEAAAYNNGTRTQHEHEAQKSDQHHHVDEGVVELFPLWGKSDLLLFVVEGHEILFEEGLAQDHVVVEGFFDVEGYGLVIVFQNQVAHLNHYVLT